MSDEDDEHEKFLVASFVHNAVASYADSKIRRSAQLFTVWWSRLMGESLNLDLYS